MNVFVISIFHNFSNSFHRRMSSMKLEEVKTLSSLYELVCHLVHSGESFLTQFCDAIAVLGADKLLVNFLSSGIKTHIRVSSY